MSASSNSAVTRRPWAVWAAATSFYFLKAVLFVAFGVFGAKIQAALTIGAGFFGGLGGLAYTIYGVLQNPLGLMLDRIGARFAYLVGLIILVGSVGGAATQ